MSAECNKCGWDLPYHGDCVVCNERGSTFKSQLAEAQGKLEKVKDWAAQQLQPCPEPDGCLDCRMWWGLRPILSKEGGGMCGGTGREQLNFKNWRLCPNCEEKKK